MIKNLTKIKITNSNDIIKLNKFILLNRITEATTMNN